MNVLQKFYEKLDSILIVRLEYKKEKIKREKDYKEAIKGCSNYKIQCDKLISEKEMLICLILHGFFVEEHKNIDFVDDSRPEFIDVKLREIVSRANYQTPAYVRSLQLLNTKAN